MAVPNFMLEAFSYQDLRRGGTLCAPPPFLGAWPDKNTSAQIGLITVKTEDFYRHWKKKVSLEALISSHYNYIYNPIQLLQQNSVRAKIYKEHFYDQFLSDKKNGSF